MDRWTNGIRGDVDDMTSQASNNPGSNLSAAAAEALAARVLRKSDPILAQSSLRPAEEEWGLAVAGLSERQRGAITEMSGHAVLAALELWQATGDRKYGDKAVEFAATI